MTPNGQTELVERTADDRDGVDSDREEFDPQAAQERRECCRHLVLNPLTIAEHDPAIFALIRRHYSQLDQWFTQRFGYRLHVDVDTARLVKQGVVPHIRPLRTNSDRPMHRRELEILALLLACTASGPLLMSLRDLVADVRSAAVEIGSQLTNETGDRRSLVTALRWMLDRGLLFEVHERVDRFAEDGEADAVLRLRPDRIALVPVPALLAEADSEALFRRVDRRKEGNDQAIRTGFRQWARCRLLEDPVLYRHDLTDAEWSELRRRVSQESRIFDEMFGLVIEARAEGIAAIDPIGSLTDLRFPTSGTTAHAAILLIDRMRTEIDDHETSSLQSSRVGELLDTLITEHGRHWSKELTSRPERLVRESLALLDAHRLVEVDDELVVLCPGAVRFATEVEVIEVPAHVQESLL
jgi:uncharacterized protein (TIGR02678 family)